MKQPGILASSIEKIARNIVGRDWNLYAVLFKHWPEIVGESYAKTTSPVKIAFPRGKKEGEKWASGQRTGGLLTIRVPAGLAMEFGFISETLRSRINGFFGYEAVGRIQLETHYGAPPPSPPTERTSLTPEARSDLAARTQQVEDEDLKKALEQLGESVLVSHEKD